EAPLAFEVVADDGDGAAAVGVTPLGVAHVEDEPAVAPRDEPVLGLLQFRLGNHGQPSCYERGGTASASASQTRSVSSSRRCACTGSDSTSWAKRAAPSPPPRCGAAAANGSADSVVG